MTTKIEQPKNYEECAERLAKKPIELSEGLTHDETLRGSALSLACRYYTETICKDGDLYREMVRDNKVLKPATYGGVLEVALAFELFLRGDLEKTAAAVTEENKEEVKEEHE